MRHTWDTTTEITRDGGGGGGGKAAESVRSDGYSTVHQPVKNISTKFTVC